jgi:hypothetical protein
LTAYVRHEPVVVWFPAFDRNAVAVIACLELEVDVLGFAPHFLVGSYGPPAVPCLIVVPVSARCAGVDGTVTVMRVCVGGGGVHDN